MASQQDIRAVNKTARSSGAVGTNAVVPNYVFDLADIADSILDFGSGPKAIHTIAMRKCGFQNVTAHEIGDNFDPEIHDKDALKRKYDWVFASNVLNVQPNEKMLLWTIQTMCRRVKQNGYLLANLPSRPRKMELTPEYCIKKIDVFMRQTGISKVSSGHLLIGKGRLVH